VAVPVQQTKKLLQNQPLAEQSAAQVLLPWVAVKKPGSQSFKSLTLELPSTTIHLVLELDAKRSPPEELYSLELTLTGKMRSLL
jgi:hypothetical protein